MSSANTLIAKTLKLVKLFEGFTEQDVIDFMRVARRQDVVAGERIVTEGRPGDDAYIVIAGELRVVSRVGTEEETIATLQAGDTFGELVLVDAGVRSASVIADGPGTLLRFQRESFGLAPTLLIKILVNVCKLLAHRLRMSNKEAAVARTSLASTPDSADGGGASVS